MARKTVECWSGSPFLQQDSTFQANAELRKDLNGILHRHDVLDDFNWALKVLYLTTLAVQIILALGNRPKGERLAYALSFWIFAILAAYLIFMTVILTIAAFCPIGTAISEEGGNVVAVLLGTTFGPSASSRLYCRVAVLLMTHSHGGHHRYLWNLFVTSFLVYEA